MYKCIVILFLSMTFYYAEAKEYDHVVQGYVIDNMTGNGMDSIHVILMTNDSTVIARTTALPKVAGELAGMYQFTIRKVGKYIVKAKCEEYEDGYMDCELRNNREAAILVKKYVWQKPLMTCQR